MAIDTAKLSHFTNQNQAVFGFYPTPLEIVKMEMNLIDFSSLKKEVPITLADFTGGEGHQLHTMHQAVLEKGLIPLSYYNELTDVRFEEAKKLYDKVEGYNIMEAPCDFFRMKLRYKEGKSLSKEVIAILRNNPPYGEWEERRGERVSSEEIFFTENTPYNIPGGIMIFEVPARKLIEIKNLLRKITYRYEEIRIFQFPEKVFKRFKQVVVVGKRKKRYSNDIELAENLRNMLEKGSIPLLEEANPCYTLDAEDLKRVRVPNLFRNGEINVETLTNGLDSILEDLLNAEKKGTKKGHRVLTERPLIELGAGHIASLMTSGAFNGILGNCLIRGGVEKKVEVNNYEDGKKLVTEETQIINPSIEITTKSGDIISKEY